MLRGRRLCRVGAGNDRDDPEEPSLSLEEHSLNTQPNEGLGETSRRRSSSVSGRRWR